MTEIPLEIYQFRARDGSLAKVLTTYRDKIQLLGGIRYAKDEFRCGTGGAKELHTLSTRLESPRYLCCSKVVVHH